MYVKNGPTGTAIAEKLAERIQTLKDSLRKINSIASAATPEHRREALQNMIVAIEMESDKALGT